MIAMELSLPARVVALLAICILVLLLCNRLRVPSLVGLLLTGIVAGPFQLGIIQDSSDVNYLANIGVILLLFTIGLEFSFKSLIEAKRAILLGGGVQVITTILATATLCIVTGLSWKTALFMGFLVSLSSTAIVMKVLQDRLELETPQGRSALGILIFQDIAVIPMLIIFPFLSETPAVLPEAPLVTAGMAVLVVLILYAAARWFVPALLGFVARERSRELFLFVIIGICFSVTLLTETVGLSFAIGAFLAGLIIGESEFSVAALSDIIPFRDVFASFFFITIGMMLSLQDVLLFPVAILLTATGIFAIKFLTGTVAAAVIGLPPRTVLLTAFSLCQIGEFSFVLARNGMDVGLFGQGNYQVFLAAAILTMGATPYLISASPELSERLSGKRAVQAVLPRQDSSRKIQESPAISDHLIIIGYGLTGKSVARAAQIAGIPYLVIEANAATVGKERALGVPIRFGDAAKQEVLVDTGISRAKVLVIVISDRSALQRTIARARHVNPGIYIIARTRFVVDAEELRELGADEIIPEEYETSVEIFARVLVKYLLPAEEIGKFVSEMRSGTYQMFRKPSFLETTLTDLGVCLPDLTFTTVRVAQGAPAAGKTLTELNLRRRFGVTVIVIRRGDDVISIPNGDSSIEAGDLLVLLTTGPIPTGVRPVFEVSPDLPGSAQYIT